MNETIKVKGLSLIDYFRLSKAESFEDSAELDCLIGQLITKPQCQIELQKRGRQKHDGSEQERKTYYETNRITQQIQQKPLKPFVSANNSPQSKKDMKLTKLSSLEFRSPSMKFHKSNKSRPKQLSISPYKRQLSKPKQSFKTLYGQSLSNHISSIQYHPILIQQSKPIQKYSRNIAYSLNKQDKKLINIRQMKIVRQFDKSQQINKNKLQGVSSLMNAYTKVLRQKQRVKYQL